MRLKMSSGHAALIMKVGQPAIFSNVLLDKYHAPCLEKESRFLAESDKSHGTITKQERMQIHKNSTT